MIAILPCLILTKGLASAFLAAAAAAAPRWRHASGRIAQAHSQPEALKNPTYQHLLTLVPSLFSISAEMFGLACPRIVELLDISVDQTGTTEKI